MLLHDYPTDQEFADAWLAGQERAHAALETCIRPYLIPLAIRFSGQKRGAAEDLVDEFISQKLGVEAWRMLDPVARGGRPLTAFLVRSLYNLIVDTTRKEMVERKKRVRGPTGPGPGDYLDEGELERDLVPYKRFWGALSGRIAQSHWSFLFFDERWTVARETHSTRIRPRRARPG